MPGFHSYFGFLHHFVTAKLATSSIRVNEKIFENHLNTDCHVGSAWIGLVEYSQMSTHVTGFQSHFSFLHHFVRPLQFNYLSYELFLEKKSCQTPKKKKKKVIFGVLRTKVVLKFSVRLQKKKEKKVQVLKIFFVSVIHSTTGSYHCCSRASDLRRYTSHPSGYRD